MSSPVMTLHGRYQLSGKPVGQGGMGVVYKAYDVVTRRHVALKTMRGPVNPAALELFAKEWSVLAQFSHPNIVDVLDTGEFEQDGDRKPFFVMPFLPGATLEQLLQNASPRLTPERIVGIILQTCRGLHAAHEHGLIHRDLKPSNIFVLDDDAVKIIDFGIVHLTGAESITALKGTLQYMAPEQIELKPCTPASDLYSLAVVTYEAFTGRKPFARKTEAETAEAVRSYIPPAIYDLNPLVSQMVSRVVHKAMAKDPWHRFASAREFAEALQKAMNGEALERFDQARIQPRIDRAEKAYSEGDHQFASEILRELEGEGNIDPGMSLLRMRIDQAIRQKSIRQLLDGVRTRLEEEEYPLALQKLQEVLAVDPENPDALGLRSQIEKQMSRRQTENWFRLVEQHIHNRSFGQARQALQEILKLNANDTRARELSAEVDRREQEVERLRGEKEQLYQSARASYERGEISSALTKLERILDLARRSPDSAIPERDAQYQNFYNQVRNEKEAYRNAYAEGRRYLADRSFNKALELSDEWLKKLPGDPMFQALKLEVEEQVRQEQSAYIAEVSRRVDAEPDLDRRVNILKEAVDRYPEAVHLEQSLRLVRERRDLVNSIVARARQHEERGQFTDALSQFEILRNIYPQYPGIEFETERLRRRRDDHVREEAKSRWIEQIDRHIALGDYARARDLVRTAQSEFPDDRELSGLERLVETSLKRSAEAEEWLQRGQKLCFDRQFREGLEALEKAASLDIRNPVIRSALLNALVEQARSMLGQDWRAAEPLIEQALHMDGGHPLARSLQGLVLDYKRQEMVSDCVSRARELQAEGDLSAALAKVEAGLSAYPNEMRLVQLRTTLQNLGAVAGPAPKQAPAPPVEKPKEPQVARPPSTPLAPTVADRSSVSDYFTIDRTMLEAARPPEPAVSKTRPAPPKTGGGTQKPGLAPGRTVVQKLRPLWKVLQNQAGPEGRFTKLQWVILLLAPTILLAAALVTLSHRPKKVVTPPASADYVVQLQCNVADARFVVDQQAVTSLPLKLKQGSHTVEAVSLGYKPDVESFTLAPDAPKPYTVSLDLSPEPIHVRLVSDLKAGRIMLDGQMTDLSDGGFTNDAVAPSMPHTLSLIQSGKETLTVSFTVEPGALVSLAGPVMAKDVKAVVITELGTRARIYASDPSLKGGVKDLPSQPIPPDGLEVGRLNGSTEFIVDDGKAPRTVPLESGNAPTLTIWLANDPNLGTVQIEANVPDAELSIDGRKRRPLKSGKNYYSLEPGVHTIRVSKEGYGPAPEQKVELKKGERLVMARFELQATPKTASLVIEGAPRDAEVLIDGLPAGSIGADGSFKRDDVAPEGHTITLRKREFEPKQLTRTFSAGQTVRIAGADAQLTAFGAIDFRVSPANASLTYQRGDDPQARTAENGKPTSMRAGRYTVRATAGGYAPRQETIDVEPGKSRSVEWVLAPVEVPKQAPPTPRTLATKEYFRDADSWKEDGAWWVHRGEGVSWLRTSQGRYVIQLRRQTSGVFKRTRHVQWMVDEKDNGDRVDYRFDFGSLERQATVGGKAEAKHRVALAATTAESYTLEIDINSEQVVVKDERGRELERYQRPNPAEPLGKFGFRGEVALVVKSGPEK